MRECVGRLAEGSTAVQQAEVERDILQNYHRQAQRDREQLQRLVDQIPYLCDWLFYPRELGGELPEGDSRQEAVLVMLGRRVEVLKEKLKGLEKEHQQRLTAGQGGVNWLVVWLLCVCVVQRWTSRRPVWTNWQRGG